jgi:carbamoyltransferase
MIVLGVHEGHDAGATLIKDGKILAAINEERLAREKLYVGIPKESIKGVLEVAGIGPGKIDRVAIAGTLGIMANLGWTDLNFKKKAYQFFSNNIGHIPSTKTFSNVQRILFKRLRKKDGEKYVKGLGIDCGIDYIDHHLCHAASAYYNSGKDACLVITSDGSGDGLSSTVYAGRGGGLQALKKIPTFHSVAYYYAYITILAGFKMFRHEGKITGLAAYGNPEKTYDVFEKCFTYGNGVPVNSLRKIGVGAINHLRKELKGADWKDYSAGIQKRTEDVMCKFIGDYADKTGLRDVAVAGGLFANVKVNQRILELPNVDSFFVHPHMGDGGIATGAALHVCAEHMLDKGSPLKPYRLDNVYFGPQFKDDDIQRAMADLRMKGERVKNVEKLMAEEMAQKRIVGHFDGRMEYGPRALGNRSILADPTDVRINDWLNKRLRRTEFMPFAPSVLDSAAPELYVGYKEGKYPASFMTITFDVDRKWAKRAPAVVHVDNTARPQVVSRDQNPKYYNILKAYEKETGLPVFVNTSFNAHEEPIVCSPEDAINSFKNGSVDTLVMGEWVLRS